MKKTPSSVEPGRPGSEVYPRSPLGEQLPGIATGRDVAWEPLVDYRRNGVSETTIHGAIAWASGHELIHSFGGHVLCYGRSMMKPFAMKVFAKELEGLLDWRQKAISVASHNGDTEHVACLRPVHPHGARVGPDADTPRCSIDPVWATGPKSPTLVPHLLR